MHKMRTLLTLVGITIGVASVIIMTSLGEGAKRDVLDRIEEMGANLIVVNAGQVKSVGGRKRQLSNVTTLTLKDSKAISEECSYLNLSAPGQSKKLVTGYDNITIKTTVLGTTADFFKIRNFKIDSGMLFSELENKAKLRVAVIGSKVKDNLFEENNALGKIIRINKIPFEVMGILKSKGINSDGDDEDDQIIIPINTALRRVFNINYLSSIFVQVTESNLMDKAESEIRMLLRESHRLNKKEKPDDFTIQNQVDILNAQREVTDSFTKLIVGIAAISLIVGGFGILTMMLISIKERINEIGLRMAIGARSKDILVQFLAEASILGFAGGMIGVIIGVSGLLIIDFFTGMNIIISLEPIIIAIGFSFSIGLFFGVYPAKKASLLDPIEALRTN